MCVCVVTCRRPLSFFTFWTRLHHTQTGQHHCNVWSPVPAHPPPSSTTGESLIMYIMWTQKRITDSRHNVESLTMYYVGHTNLVSSTLLWTMYYETSQWDVMVGHEIESEIRPSVDQETFIISWVTWLKSRLNCYFCTVQPPFQSRDPPWHSSGRPQVNTAQSCFNPVTSLMNIQKKGPWSKLPDWPLPLLPLSHSSVPWPGSASESCLPRSLSCPQSPFVEPHR